MITYGHSQSRSKACTLPFDYPSSPVVSVVIPVYDAADVIGDAVASIQAQTFPDWEAILVDDGAQVGSTQTQVLAAIAAADPRVTVVATAGKQGAGPARNLGMETGTGQYIAFLDADDLWHPRKLELQLAAMRAQSAPVSCTAFDRVNVATGKTTTIGVPATVTRSQLLRTNVIACSSAIFDRAHFGNRQMPALRRRQDFAFWLSLLADGSQAIGVPFPLMTYRQMPTSLSAPKHKAARDTWTMYRAHLGLNPVVASYYFGSYALRGVARHFAPGLARKLGWVHSTRPVPQ